MSLKRCPCSLPLWFLGGTTRPDGFLRQLQESPKRDSGSSSTGAGTSHGRMRALRVYDLLIGGIAFLYLLCIFLFREDAEGYQKGDI